MDHSVIPWECGGAPAPVQPRWLGMLVTYSPAAVPGGRPQYKEHDVFGNLQLHVTAILGEEPLLKQLRRPQGARARKMPSLGITLWP